MAFSLLPYVLTVPPKALKVEEAISTKEKASGMCLSGQILSVL